jgi:hypothetical protein
MEGEGRRCQVLHRQARELVYKVLSYFKREAAAGMPVHDVAKAQDVCISLSAPLVSVRAGQYRWTLAVSFTRRPHCSCHSFDEISGATQNRYEDKNHSPSRKSNLGALSVLSCPSFTVYSPNIAVDTHAPYSGD